MRKQSLQTIMWLLLFCAIATGIWNGKVLQVKAAHVAHPDCGKTSECVLGTSTHPSVSWQAWDGTSSFSGSYVYLTKDAQWTSGTFSITGNVTICLNGHNIEFADGVSIKSGATLSFCDCVGGGKVTCDSIYLSGYSYIWGGNIDTQFYVQEGGNLYLHGGSASEIIVFSGGKAYLGFIEGRKCSVTRGASNYGTMKIESGATSIKYLMAGQSSLTEITSNGTIDTLDTYPSSTLYIAGKPTIKSSSISSSTELYASNQAKTSYYEGSKLYLYPKNGTLVYNVKDQAHTEYFALNNTTPAKLSLDGTNLNLYYPIQYRDLWR